MKTKTNGKKLNLKKITISNLNNAAMRMIIGGVSYGTLCLRVCPSTDTSRNCPTTTQTCGPFNDD